LLFMEYKSIFEFEKPYTCLQWTWCCEHTWRCLFAWTKVYFKVSKTITDKVKFCLCNFGLVKVWKPNYLLAMNLVLWAYLRVLSVSSKLVSDGERQASIRVRAFPPKESYKNKITF
jgi:hypothetical protein